VVVLFDTRPAPVLLAVAAPARQRRGTVAVRLVLAVPHLVALALLSVGAVVVTVTGWGAALILGRLPRFAGHYLSGYLRFQTRLTAYLFLLTDVYPPFSFLDAPYPVRVTVQPGPLHRGAVALRLVLAVPAIVVAAIVTEGIATVVLIVTWAIVLVRGRLPSALHDVFAAFVRYEARLVGYLTMVTSQYPWGLLGDPETAMAAASSAGAPLWQPTPPSPPDDPYWRVVLPAPAKNLVVLFLVLGMTSVVSVQVVSAVTRYHQLQTEQTASSRVQGAYRTLTSAVDGYQSETRSCDSTAVPLTCLTAAAQNVSRAFTGFGRRLASTTVPTSATAARAVLVSDSTRAEHDFDVLSASTTAGRYQLVIESSNLSQLLLRFDQDYEELGLRLTNPG
jgi:hypothetical protein